MFCPLCKAEFREGVDRCPNCHALLAASEDGSTDKRRRVVWCTMNREAAHQARDALRAAGLPCCLKSLRDHWLYAIAGQRPSFELWILKSDSAAVQSALAHLEPVPQFEDEPVVLPTPLILHCPLCREEHPAESERCPGCGVELAAWREPWPEEDVEENPPELVWRGSELVTFSRAIAALREEAIPFRPTITADHLAFGMAMPRPKLEIFVFRSDGERARGAVGSLVEPSPLLSEVPPAEGEEPSAARSEGLVFPGPFGRTNREPSAEARYEQRKRFVQFGAACVTLPMASVIYVGWVSQSIGLGQALTPFGRQIISLQVIVASMASLCGLAILWRVFYGAADKLASVARLFFFLGVLWLLILAGSMSLSSLQRQL